MSLDKVLVLLFGTLAVLFIYWFFLMKKTKEITAEDSIDITVSGGYSPEVISVKKGKKLQLNFIRKDPSSCLEEVVLGDFKIRKHLPLNKKVSVEITPQQTGEYIYSCGMNMYHGKIIVK